MDCDLPAITGYLKRLGLNARAYPSDLPNKYTSFTITLGPEHEVAYFTIDLESDKHTAFLKNFSVATRYRGRGISLALLKTIDDLVRECGKTNLAILSVRQDGRSFWPWAGARPLIQADMARRLSCAFSFAAQDDVLHIYRRRPDESDEECWLRMTNIMRPCENERRMLASLTQYDDTLRFELEKQKIVERLRSRYGHIGL